MYSLVRLASRVNLTRAFCTTYPRAIPASKFALKQEEPKSRAASSVSLTNLKQLSTSVPKLSADHHHGDHSKLWTIERGISVGLLTLCPAAFVIQNPIMDYALALALAAHIHWGLEAIIVDYVRPRVVGQLIANAAVIIMYAVSIIMIGGLFYFNYTDVGLVNAVKMLWRL